MITLSTLLLATFSPQGDPATAPTQDKPTRQELARAVAKAHRPGGKKTEIDRYMAAIRVHIRDKRQKSGSINIELKVRYGKAIERAPGKTMPMVHFETSEGGKRIQRGMGPRGPWLKIGDELKNLNARENQTDAELLENHLRLCKVMLKFLDPGEIIGFLRDGEAVFDVPLQIGRGRKNQIQTHLISGTLSSFPLSQGQGKKVRDQMVWMEAWIDQKTNLLRKVRVRPWTGKGKAKASTGEDIVFDKFKLVDGVILPLQLKFYDVQGDRSTPKVTIDLNQLALNPALKREHFLPN